MDMPSPAAAPFLRLHPDDDVAVATRAVPPGTTAGEVTTAAAIPAGHKVALRAVPAGAPIRKYGQVIGVAASAIAAGDHVHVHNCAFVASAHAHAFASDLRPAAAAAPETFMGYRRDSGDVGTRNYVAIVTSVNCSATAARRIAAAFGPGELAAYPNVDGVVAYVHGTGCGMAASGDGFEALQRVMWGYARHPNHAAVLMVGLGCETNQIDWLLEAWGVAQGPTFRVMNIQGVAGLRRTVEAGIEAVRAMLPVADAARREPCPASSLRLGLQCGGSDAWSGVTANPALGHACDILVAQGGTGVLSETPEIYGAEHLLTRRAVDARVGGKLLERIAWWEGYVARAGGSMDNNPSPGNKRGGLTTILEKSLGAVAKGGTTPLADVVRYAEPVRGPGLVFMDTPGYDPASVTGQIAGGCQLVCFTTGRGSAFGSKPAPTLKVATTTALHRRMDEDMDIDAGAILEGRASVEETGRAIWDALLRVASGEATKSEAQGLGDDEFVPWQIGATM